MTKRSVLTKLWGGRRKKTRKKWPYLSLAIFFVTLIALFLYGSAYAYWYQGRIYPGVKIGNIDVGGFTPAHAQKLLVQIFDRIKQQGFSFVFEDYSVSISPTITSPTDPDLTYELITWSPHKTIGDAYQRGRNGSWWRRILLPLSFIAHAQIVPADMAIDEEKLTDILRENLQKFETPPLPPRIRWTGNSYDILEEKDGSVFDYAAAARQTAAQLRTLAPAPQILTLRTTPPPLRKKDITAAHTSYLDTLATIKPTLIWRAGNNTWKFPFNDYKEYLEWDGVAQNSTTLSISSQWIKNQLSSIKKTIDNPARDAKFTVKDGRVVEFQQSKDGVLLNQKITEARIKDNFLVGIWETDLVTVIDKAKIQTEDVNDLGITEIIGVGVSDFSGSPENRRHNIAIGAQSLNGLLIRPGEEFSLIKALLPIDQTKGYLPELVIKGGKTIPEYGGGLCQIGTTTFRAALKSGLPITARQNHSYRIRYYEPAGTDATIYDPAPDFRFLNDTPGSILIQTRMENDKLIFEFWGTNDGRIATSTQPKIYNITKPPPTKYIKTSDLAPGEIKCTEKAHDGADAEFTYTVTYPDGTVEERIFKSHYRPWQEVCLVGESPDESNNKKSNQ